MSKKQINLYAACDKAIKAMNRENLELFGRLKMLNFEKEKSIIKEVTYVYGASRKRARKRYYEIGFEAYLLGMTLCGIETKRAHAMAEKAIDEEWVDAILEQTDFLTLYRFNSESERKCQRLIEALAVSEDRDFEVNKALRLWSQQLGQYAINVTDYAVIQAYEDAGIEFVEWVTQEDERVCNECYALNGQVFRIDSVPPKVHYGCRCMFRPRQDIEQDPESETAET